MSEERIRFELTQIGRELEETKPLFAKVRALEPDPVELRAVASTLHAVYNGMENILVVMAKEVDGGLPSGSSWHRELLSRLGSDTEERGRLISERLKGRLEALLGFRHFYRHAYGIRLRWGRMKPLAEELPDLFSVFKSEVEAFLESRGGGEGGSP